MSQDHPRRLFHKPLELAQELGPLRAIDCAMIAETVATINFATVTTPSRITGQSRDAPMPRTALCPGVMIGKTWSTPNIPKFEMVKVPSALS